MTGLHPDPLLFAERPTRPADDPLFDRLAATCRELAAAAAAAPPVQRRIEGDGMPRLLAVSREALRRICCWGLCDLLDDDANHLERVWTECEAILAFDDWHPRHFLDTAELSLALGLALDWWRPAWSGDRRRALVDGLARLGIEPSFAAEHWWIDADNNWNQVCHGSLVTAALALAPERPELCERVLDRARRHYARALAVYAPDGVYPEGPMYWDYGTSFTVVMAAALASRLGTTWDILAQPGLVKSFTYREHMTTPTGRLCNYADCRETSGPLPLHGWMADAVDSPGLGQAARDSFATWLDHGEVASAPRLLPLALGWWPAPVVVAGRPTCFVGAGSGAVHIATLRTGWEPEATFASLKGGSVCNHCHLDAGSFIFEAGGRRWADDFGMERAIYDRTDTWGVQDQDSPRWGFLRANNLGHNTLSFGDRLQRVDGRAPLLAVDTEALTASMDLGAVYADQAGSVQRHLGLSAGRLRCVDRIVGLGDPLPVTWRLFTRATVTRPADDRTANLQLDGRNLLLRVVAPVTAVLDSHPARPKTSAEAGNEGHTCITVSIAAPPTEFEIIVELRLL